MGERFPVVVNGQTALQKGTSASTPFLSALIVSINDLRLRAGKPAVGFLSPLLYTGHGKASLRDITEFSIEGYELGESFMNGYDASTGWDPASGLGGAKFESLPAFLR